MPSHIKNSNAQCPLPRQVFSEVEFGREICGSLEVAELREWLTTNGTGGYASETVAGMVTRCYRGLLVATTNPPVGRTIMLVKADATLGYRGETYDLFTNRWAGGAADPAGYKLIFDLAREREPGHQDHEDHLHAVTFKANLGPGESVILAASTEASATADPLAIERRRAHEASLMRAWAGTRKGGADSAPGWITQLVLAADQFVVSRETAEMPDGKTIIAGYHWFGDWGRDTMVSLPGLTLVTGLTEVARSILTTFSSYMSQGMLRNRFPDRGAYKGDLLHRDSSYHQGIVWGWLKGPFIEAHLRVHGDAARAELLLSPFEDLISQMGLGTLSEINDGDAPMQPRGCIAQAWSVAEALRAWCLVEEFKRRGVHLARHTHGAAERQIRIAPS